MKVGNIVRLKKQAVNRFYGTNKNAEMYELKEGDMTSDEFVQYVNDILSFEDGNYGGIVYDIVDDIVHVKHINRIYDGTRIVFIDIDDLEVVME